MLPYRLSGMTWIGKFVFIRMSFHHVLTVAPIRAIGSLFMMGFDGSTVTPQIKTLIEDYHLGSILLKAQNLKCTSLPPVTGKQSGLLVIDCPD